MELTLKQDEELEKLVDAVFDLNHAVRHARFLRKRFTVRRLKQRHMAMLQAMTTPSDSALLVYGRPRVFPETIAGTILSFYLIRRDAENNPDAGLYSRDEIRIALLAMGEYPGVIDTLVEVLHSNGQLRPGLSHYIVAGLALSELATLDPHLNVVRPGVEALRDRARSGTYLATSNETLAHLRDTVARVFAET